jgi:hypothetical protein
MIEEGKNVSHAENKKYVFSIIKIILLTNIPAIVFLPADVKNSLGWILGSIASAANFWFMTYKVYRLSPDADSKSAHINTSKVFMLRFLFLIVWSVFVLAVIRPNVVSFCIGLLAAQVSVFIYHIYYVLTHGKLKKYFRSEDEEKTQS